MMLSGMRTFVLVTLLYVAVALLVVYMRYPNLEEVLVQAAATSIDNIGLVKGTAFWFLPIAAVLPFVMSFRDLKARLVEVFCAAVGCVLTQVAFTFMKSSIPSLIPFYADPALADIDWLLHGGNDPWQLAHAWVAPATALMFLPVYLQIWSIPAMSLPVLIALSDQDGARIRRFTLLFLFCWIGLGNVAATLFSSVGPVFYDGLIGGDRFASLLATLSSSGVSTSMIGKIQSYLWAGYEAQGLTFGSGISAFPSVHLGIATTTALYLFERSRLLLPVGIAFVAVIQFLSVYTGYHYAIDGYFSIAAVIGLWVVLRRRQGVTGAQQNYAAD